MPGPHASVSLSANLKQQHPTPTTPATSASARAESPGRDEFLPYGLNRKKDMAVSCGPGMPGPLQDAQFFSGIFGWLYSIFHKYEQNMSLPS